MPKAYATRDSNLRPSSVKSDTLTIMLQDPCLQSILPSHSLSLCPGCKGLGFSLICSCEKTFVLVLKCVFPRCSCETLRPARLCKKNIFSGTKKNVFSYVLLSNLPTPPRYLALARSKLRRCIQYITKNALRTWGTLDLLWWKFVCI